MARARDIAFIRKLCGLNVPAQSLVQSLLPALRLLIPSHSAGVFWVDEHGDIARLYAERMLPPDAMARYYERHYQTARDGFVAAFRHRADQPDPVSSHSFSEAAQATDYFRDVMRPLDAYHVMYGVLKHDNAPFAQISFYRGRTDSPFGRNEIDTLRDLLQYLATGLSQDSSRLDAADESVVVEEHLGIVDPEGRIASASESWRRLLRLAALSDLSPRNASQEHSITECFLRNLCADFVHASHNGRRWQFERPSTWGRFAISAFLLSDARGRRSDQIGLLIRREESRSVCIVRGTGLTDLSPQQREVAILLAEGKSNRQIAEEMNVSLNTASYHVKQVYAKLGITDRGAVSGRLLQLAQLAAAIP